MNATSAQWAIRGLTLVALLVSAYLTWTTLQQADVVGCGMASVVDCDEVLTSKWSRWFGIPVGMLGLVVYALLFGCSWFLIVDEFEPGRSRYPWMASLALGLTAAASGIWFIGLQAFSIQSFCIYCLAVHVCGIATAILLWLHLPSGDESQDFAQTGAMLGVQAGMGGFADEEEAVLTSSDLYVSAGIAVAGLLVLTIGQFLTSEPKSTLVVMETRKEVVEESDATSQSDVESGSPAESLSVGGDTETGLDDEASKDDAAGDGEISDTDENTEIGETIRKRPRHRRFRGKSRIVEFEDVDVSFDVYDMPIVGDHEAPHVIMEFADYTCPECRKMHGMLSEALERHKGQIAVALCPIALNHKCNPVIPKRRKGKSQFACEYAKLALAVWLEDPTKFVEFHNWLMEDEKIPTVTAAKRHAMRLVGWGVLSDWLYSDAIKEMLNSNHEIFAEKIKRVPVLIVGNSMVAGAPKESAEFDGIFQAKLDLSDDGAQQVADDSDGKVDTTTNVLLDADSASRTKSLPTDEKPRSDHDPTTIQAPRA